MTVEMEKGENPKTKEITFQCKVCQNHKTLDEIISLTIYSPPVIVCQDCARKLR